MNRHSALVSLRIVWLLGAANGIAEHINYYYSLLIVISYFTFSLFRPSLPPWCDEDESQFWWTAAAARFIRYSSRELIIYGSNTVNIHFNSFTFAPAGMTSSHFQVQSGFTFCGVCDGLAHAARAHFEHFSNKNNRKFKWKRVYSFHFDFSSVDAHIISRTVVAFLGMLSAIYSGPTTTTTTIAQKLKATEVG